MQSASNEGKYKPIADCWITYFIYRQIQYHDCTGTSNLQLEHHDMHDTHKANKGHYPNDQIALKALTEVEDSNINR